MFDDGVTPLLRVLRICVAVLHDVTVLRCTQPMRTWVWLACHPVGACRLSRWQRQTTVLAPRSPRRATTGPVRGCVGPASSRRADRHFHGVGRTGWRGSVVPRGVM